MREVILSLPRAHRLEGWILTLVLFVSAPLHAQEVTANEDSHRSSPAVVQAGIVNNRIFGVLPNHRTMDGHAQFSPLRPRQKLSIAVKDSFDPPVYLITGAYALIHQAKNDSPSFGQGFAGYAKRYGATYGDMAIGNMVTEGFLPVLIHEDPRYFRNGEGSTHSRLAGALKQIVIGRKDSGRWGFNFSEFWGGAAAAGISNLYYPDSRTAPDNLKRFASQIGNDAISNVLKEFWPDIKHRLFERRPQGK
jgi:hypothetical protein